MCVKCAVTQNSKYSYHLTSKHVHITSTRLVYRCWILMGLHTTLDQRQSHTSLYTCTGEAVLRYQPDPADWTLVTGTIVWMGIQADLAFGSNFFYSHPPSTHIWYQNVQLTFRRQFRQTFTKQDSKWKQKTTKSLHSSSCKKGFPMVFPRMRTRQVQWRNWNGGV